MTAQTSPWPHCSRTRPRHRDKLPWQWLAAVAVLAVLSAAGSALAEVVPVSPGPLSAVHERFGCVQCHGKSLKQPDKQCLTCHQNIQASVLAQRGLHGGELARGSACSSCHKEHRGQRADLLNFKAVGGMAALDHGKVGFPFAAGHARFADSPCESCHERRGSRTIFANSQLLCSSASCHVDVHAGSVGQDCARCHESSGWRPRVGALAGAGGGADAKGALLRFDHNRDTRFALVGRHQEVAAQGRCRACHKGPEAPPTKTQPLTFKIADQTCYGCHRSDDEQNGHRGQKGRDCGSCHLPITRYFWDARGLPIGHSRATQPIGGAHDRLGCLTCHTGWRKLTGLAESCATCHQRDDIHHNSLGPRCGDCHTQQSFLAARFRHDSVGCSLRGLHRVLPCADCHKGGNYAGLTPLCIGCHRDDAMRAAAQGIVPELHVVQTACTNCHNTNSFRLGAGTRQSPPESVCQ